jgi:glutamine amidotransferase
MQLMASEGREHRTTRGLSWIEGAVVPLEPGPGLKVPHMGWNELEPATPRHPVLAGLPEGAHVYFVHGFRFDCARPDAVLAVARHGVPFAAAIGRDNLFGTQFHPEKSQGVGLRLITNFLNWCP